MAFSIDNFTSKFANLARSYMFMCQFGDNKDLQFLVESTVLPSKTIQEVEVNYQGQQIKVAGNVTYENWTCTFRVDSKYEVYKEFRTWMAQVRNDNGGVGKDNSFRRELVLHQLSEDADDNSMNPVSALILTGAFPTVLGEIAYDTKTSDVQTFTVTFAYNYHTWTKI